MPSFLWFSEKWPHAIFIIEKIIDDEDGEFEDCEITFFMFIFIFICNAHTVPPKHHDGIYFERFRQLLNRLALSWLVLALSVFHAPHLISIPALVESFSCQFLLRLLASSGLYLTYAFLNLSHKGRQWIPKFPKTTVFISTGVITVSYKKRCRVCDTVLWGLYWFL